MVRFHFASLQTAFPSSSTRGRPAISCACAPRRGLYSSWSKETAGVSYRLERILGPAWGPLLPQEVTLRLLSEGGDRESPALQDWDFRNPSEGFSFLVVSVSLFQKGTAGVNYDRFQGFEDCISCTPIARPLQTHMSLWEQ